MTLDAKYWKDVADFFAPKPVGEMRRDEVRFEPPYDAQAKMLEAAQRLMSPEPRKDHKQ